MKKSQKTAKPLIHHRRCVSCRRVADRQEFWRVVRVAGKVQLDSGMGRSAYLCPTADCLTAARKKNRLSRALKAPVGEETYQWLEERLQNHRDAGAEIP
jgi:uncharacterized protein